MQLTVLGCHGPYPCAGGATSGYLVRNGEKSLLMDCGSGVLGRLMALQDPALLAGVLLTHLHFDHMSDLPVLRYYLESRGKTLPVYVPEEDHSPQRALLEETNAFRVEAYPETLEMAGLQISACPVRHPVPCRALRLTDGEKTLVYTGDSNVCDALTPFAAGADVLLCDAAFLQHEWKETAPHMCARQAAELARNAKVHRLYLTHLPVRHDPETLRAEAADVFSESVCVFPGMHIEI